MSQQHLEKALLRLQSNDDFQQFLRHIQDRLAIAKTDLMAMPDNLSFYRTQGEALCLARLIEEIESATRQSTEDSDSSEGINVSSVF